MRHTSLISLRLALLSGLGLIHACGGRAAAGADSSQGGSGAQSSSNRGGSGGEATEPGDAGPGTVGTMGGMSPVDPVANGGGGQGGSAEGGSGGGNGGGGSGGDPPTGTNCGAPINQGNGFVQCLSGIKHRATTGVCRTALPRPEPTVTELPPAADAGAEDVILPFEYVDEETGTQYHYECLEDADCVDDNLGLCTLATLDTAVTGESFLTVTATCSYGCSEYWECGEGAICDCGELRGTCVPATCTTTEDCAGELCARYEFDSGCGIEVGYACTSPLDECVRGQDCEEGQCTYVEDGNRMCSGTICNDG
jgi:hypothetical protein